MIDLSKCVIESVNLEKNPNNCQLYILRLDKMHPYVSGNKWFKIIENYHAMISENKNTLITFGGAYSNHLYATAAFGKKYHINTIGIVRGDELTETSNITLERCSNWGMDLYFVSRSEYLLKAQGTTANKLIQKYDAYILPEGGDNMLGVLGAESISKMIPDNMDYICCPVGTGTTIAGIIRGTKNIKKYIGFAPFKKVDEQFVRITKWTSVENLELLNDRLFGGFGKYNQQLLDFINAFKQSYNIPLDVVYNAKMWFSISEMIQSGKFTVNSNILCVHTGGLR